MSINLDTSNGTHQGPPDGTQGYLAACYRNIFDTKPSQFRSRIRRNQVASRIENRKEPNGSNRRSNQLTKKKIAHTLRHVELSIGLIDAVQGLH